MSIAPRSSFSSAAVGFGQGYGAVLSRKAYAVAAAAGNRVDGGTAAYQRILGGLVNYGFLGLFVGPVILAIGRAAWEE